MSYQEQNAKYDAEIAEGQAEEKAYADKLAAQSSTDDNTYASSTLGKIQQRQRLMDSMNSAYAENYFHGYGMASPAGMVLLRMNKMKFQIFLLRLKHRPIRYLMKIHLYQTLTP